MRMILLSSLASSVIAFTGCVAYAQFRFTQKTYYKHVWGGQTKAPVPKN